MSQMSGEEFIDEIRKIDERLKNARISSIEIVKAEKRIKYRLICDNTVDDELQKKAWTVARKITPRIFEKVNVYFTKIVSNDELINAEILKYVSANFKSVAIGLKPTDVKSTVVGEKVKYTIKMTQSDAEYFNGCNVFAKISEHLSKKFCSDFYGAYEIKEKEETESLLSDEVYREKVEKVLSRTIKLNRVIAIDDDRPKNVATYIEDATAGNVTLCGKIYEIVEKTTKNGKPFFVIRFDDTTGKISGLYFTRKKTYEKVKALKEGDAIIASGRLGEYNGNPSFTIEKINGCEFPEDFVKQEKYKKSAPERYKTVFPTPAETVKIKSVFEVEKPLPDDVIKNDYVVFDIETTGLEPLSCEIIEIGAVKITGGKITEQFVSFVKPDGVIPERITELTGIDAEMVKNAPKIVSVLPDFLKFVKGTTVIAQHAEFDVSFIKKYASANDYAFENPILDTEELARNLVHGLKHYDLHTLGEYFNVTFRHHRALSDAYATAEVFLELMKIKGQRT